MDAPSLEIFDDVEQMADRSGEAIEANDDEHFAGAEIFQQLRKDRSCARRTGSELLMNTVAASCPQFVNLRVVELIVGRNAGISDQSLGEGRGTGLYRFRHWLFDPFSVTFVQIRNALEKDPLQACFIPFTESH